MATPTSTTTITSTISLTSTVVLNPSYIPPTTGSQDSSAQAIPLPQSFVSSTLVTSAVTSSKLTPTASKTALPLGASSPFVPSELIGLGPADHKAAVAGAVLGTLIAVSTVAIVAFLYFRRRKRELQGDIRNNAGRFSSLKSPRISTNEHSNGEKGTPRLPPLPVSELPIIDHNLIRMSLDHWDRPFAFEDPLRDPATPASLRIANPDPSRPTTPRVATNDSGRFLPRQRSALAAVLFPFKRSTSHHSLAQHTPLPDSSPVIGDALSEELRLSPAVLLARPASPVSSITSSHIRRHRPPDDPFLDVPCSTRRPIVSPLQSTAGRSISHMSSFLSAFRMHASQTPSRSTSSETVPNIVSPSRRNTGTSDPFEIDPRGTIWPVQHEDGRQESPNWLDHTYDAI